MRLLPLLMLLCVTAFAAEAFNPYRTVPEVRLADGRTFNEFRAISYTIEGINATWRGGGGVVPYAQMPAEWGDAIARFRPKPRPQPSPAAPPQATPLPVERSSGAIRIAPVSVKPVLVKDITHPSPDFSPLTSGDFSYKRALLSRSIEGQCFIVTNGRNNVKLGLVPVGVYPVEIYSRAAEIIRKRNSAYEGEWEYFLKVLQHAKEYGRAVKEFQLNKRNRWQLWQLLPPSPFTTKTDADGRFSIKHDIDGDFVVVAYGSRSVGDDHEYYFWAVFSENVPKSGPLLLSNDNHR